MAKKKAPTQKKTEIKARRKLANDEKTNNDKTPQQPLNMDDMEGVFCLTNMRTSEASKAPGVFTMAAPVEDHAAFAREVLEDRSAANICIQPTPESSSVVVPSQTSFQIQN